MKKRILCYDATTYLQNKNKKQELRYISYIIKGMIMQASIYSVCSSYSYLTYYYYYHHYLNI